jgi:hypothetical protein
LEEIFMLPASRRSSLPSHHLPRIAAALIVTLAVALVAMAAMGQNGASQDSLRAGGVAGPAHFEDERFVGTIAQNNWEPANAADPNSSWVYQLVSNQAFDTIDFRASSDGGRTWAQESHVCEDAQHPVYWQYDPQIQVTQQGIVYVVCLDTFNHPGIVFTKSQDHGATWSKPVMLRGDLVYTDKPVLVTSPSGRDIYIAFNDFFVLYEVTSHDYGTTFSAPVAMTTDHLWFYSYEGTIAPDGTAYFGISGEGHGPGNPDEQAGPAKVGVSYSKDRGRTWSTIYLEKSQEGARCDGPNCYTDFFTAQTAIAVDRSGHIVLAYTQNGYRRGPNSLYVRTSDDSVHWGPPILVNALGNNTCPQLATGPGPGDFRLVWQDSRNGDDFWNTWYARSTDGGRSWSPDARLSNVGGGASYKSPAGYKFPYGDYLSLSVNRTGENFIIWGEGTGIYTGGGSWFTHGQ